MIAGALALPALATAAPTLGAGGPLPLAFEPNHGQADGAVKFLARGRGYGLFLTPTESVLVLAPGDRRGPLARRPGPAAAPTTAPSIVRMRLVGGDPRAVVAGVAPLPGRSHYVLGERERWHRDVPTFARVRYSDVYPGVSLVFYGTERDLEYDFVVAPGADPGAVELAFEGADSLRLDAGGDLVITTTAGDLRLRRPVIYQEAEEGRRHVEGGYLLDGTRVRFRVAAWDAARPLVIDPVLGYSTYLGGASNDQGLGIVVDQLGNAYVTGSTISSDFPISAAAAQPARAGVTDVFVAKLDPTGTTLLYSTYLGGSGDDAGNAIAVDVAGNAYVAGTTNSTNFPVLGAFQAMSRGGNDAFVAKLDPDGSALVYSTYLGSNTDDFAFGIALDAAGNAYVTGSTATSTFPNNNTNNGNPFFCLGIKRTGNDAFVARLAAAGSTLDYCAFLGGSGDDSGQAVAADAAGNVWVVGATTSTNLPVVNALQPLRGGRTDGFVGRLDTGGNVVYLTYLGGGGDDVALAVAADTLGNAYVTGSTTSTNFPVSASALQPALAGGSDAFVTKLSPSGTTLLFSTYLGGGADDIGNGIAVHPAPADSTVYVTGSTESIDFPTLSPVQAQLAGGLDAFVTKLAATGSALVYSTYLGGAGDDAAQAIAVDVDGTAYLTGATESAAFPTRAPIQNAAGLLDAFVTQVADGGIIQFTASGYQVGEDAGSITIGVQRTGDTSGPASVEFVTTDGTAAAGADYQAVTQTLVFAPGQVVTSVVVPINDDPAPDGDRTVTLTLRNAAGGATLGSRSQVTLTILDNESAINFSAAVYQVAENAGPAVITVTRSGPAAGTVTVRFSTADGTATAGTDYTAVTRTLTFAPAVRTQTIPVPILNDTRVDGTQTVNLSLTTVNGGIPAAVLGLRSSAVINIVDDDRGGTLRFSAANFNVNEPAALTGTATATITVQRTGGTASGVTVDYAVTDGTAAAGANYTPVTGTLSFGAGQTSLTFAVTVLNDGRAQGNVAANLVLSNPTGGGLLGAGSAATLTIVDAARHVAFTATGFNVSERLAEATVSVRRGGASTGTVTVQYTTADGSAVEGVDYRRASGTLTFAAGSTVQTFKVPLLNNTRVDSGRTVNLSLNTAVGAEIVTPFTATLMIADDEAGGIIEFASQVFVVPENIGAAVVTVSRTGGTAAGATVQYATVDGSATATVDYTPTSGTLTFGQGETVKTFSVPILNDATPEGVETINLTLSAPSAGAIIGGRATAVLRIVDDELALGFSAPNYTVSEGAGSATITAELTGVNAVPVTVSYATSNGTATAGLDYAATTGSLVFPPGGTATTVRTQSFSVPILQDTLAEGVETVNLTLSSPAPALAQLVPVRSTALLSITDDDQGGIVELESATFSVLENAGTATIRVKRSAGAASGVTVDYATGDGSATAGLDYTATSGRLTFAAGELIRTFTIPIINDALGEGPETVNLTLSNPGGGGTVGTQATAVLTINDDEPHVLLSAAAYSVSEGAGFLIVTVNRGGVSTGQVTVDYATADQLPVATGKAVAAVDYTATTGTLTFGTGVTSRTFTVPILNNSLPQTDRTFVVALSNPLISAGTVTLVAPSSAEVTITDDDIGGVIQLTAPTSTVNEDGGEAAVTLVRSGGQAGGVSVRLQTSDLFVVAAPLDPPTASAGSDYTSTDIRVTFGPGEMSKTVRIPILPDAAAEGTEFLYLKISEPQPAGAPGTPTLGTQNQATLSIVDAQATVQLSKATFTVAEGSAVATVTVDRTAPGGRLTVDFATSDGTATAPTHYLGASGSLTFEQGVTSQSFTVRLVDNQAVEPDRQFGVVLSNVQPPAAATLGPRTTANVLIKENDRGGLFSVTAGSLTEGGPSENPVALVTVSRTGGSGGPVSVVFHAHRCGLFGPACDFPAREGTDFDVIDNTVLVFQPGELSKTIPVTIHGNDIPEGSRDVQVAITDPSPSFVQDGQEIGAQIGGGDALLRIVEDDLYFVALSAETYSAPEGARQALITVVRTGLPGFLAQSLTLDIIAFADGPAPAVAGQDFVDLGGGMVVAEDPAFTFAPNQTTKTFRVPFLDDTVVDGPKTITVLILSSTPSSTDSPRGPGFVKPRSAVLTVTDDDTGGVIEFSADAYSVAEDVASGLATITLARTGPPNFASGVSVVAETGDFFAATTPPQTGVPGAGGDYLPTSTLVTFAAGAATTTFTVPIVNDGGSADGVKTVNLQIRDAQPAGVGAAPSLGTRKTAVLRIVDASQSVGFQLANYDVSEAAGTAVIQIERTGDVSVPMTVTFSTSDDTAVAGVHYTAVTGVPVNFGIGQTLATVSVPLTDNNAVAADTTLNLALTAPTVGALAASRDTATLTLKDDDKAGTIAFAAASFVAQEKDGQAVLTITRTGGTGGCPVPLAGPPPSCPDATLVTFSTSDGTATAAGGDYTAVTGRLVEFGAGELVKTVTIPVNPDAAAEGTETVTLTLTDPQPAGFTDRSPVLGLATATLQIVETEIRIGATAYTVAEGTGKATLTIVRTGDVGTVSTIDFVTADGTATTGAGDYGTTNGTLTFAAGVAVLTLDVILTDDTIAETDESFDVVFSNPTNATIGRTSCSSATPAEPALVATCTVAVTVLDNDSGGLLSFSQPVYDVNENAGQATITVRRIVGGAGPVTVDFATSDGSALAGVDYTATTQTLTFNPGEVSKTVTVPVLNNTLGVRSANLLLRSAAGGATLGTPASALLRIVDVSNSVGFTAIGYTVDESAGSAAITLLRTGTTGDVLVDFATSDGGATAAGGDYTAVTTTITFPAGVNLRTVLVPITNDGLIEPAENLTLTLSNPRLAGSLTPVAIAPDSCLVATVTTCTASLTILDDDQGGVISLTSSTYTVNENGGAAVIALSRVGGLAGGVTVTFGATAGTADPLDFTAPSTTVTFLAGQTTATVPITINDNALAQNDRTILIGISNPQPAGLVTSPVLGARTSATLTILDNEPQVRFTPLSGVFAATEGTTAAVISVTRSGDPSVEVHVDYATGDGTATAPARYTPVAGTLTFAPGTLTRTFMVPIVNDSVLQSSQTVLLFLSNPTTVPVSPGRAMLVGINPATLVLTDDDRSGTVAFGASSYSVGEAGGQVIVSVTRTAGNAGAISVGYSVIGGSAVNGVDYTLAPGSVTFGVNEMVRTFTIPVIDNALAEGNKTIVLGLSTPTAPAILGAPSEAVVTIVDDEATLKFGALGFTVLENRGPATITVERLGTATGTLLVDFATVNGPAGAPADYTAVARPLTFGPGVRTQSVPVVIVNDTLIEGNETFDVRLSNPRFSPASPTAVSFAPGTCDTFLPGPPPQCSVPVTIVDDDQGGQVQFSAATYTVAETAATALITLTRTGGMGGPVTVDFSTVDGTGIATALLDYAPVARTVTFAANATTQTVAIPIINDTLREPNETINLQITNPGGGVSLGGRDTAVLTITDNDVAGVVQFGQALYTVSESAVSAAITITRSGGTASGVTVDFTTTDGTAVAGADYVLGNTTVTFGAGETTRTVVVGLTIDDGTPEGNKLVNLTLSNPGGGAALGARSTAVLKILDNEATVQFSAPAFSVTEGGAASLPIERTGTAGTVIVRYTTSDGSGAAGTDYRATIGTLTFNPGVALLTATVPTISNTRQDGPRGFNVTLTVLGGTAGAVLGPQSAAAVTILDEDRAGALAFSSASYLSSELGFVTLSVRRPSNANAGPATVAYATVDGTAHAGLDYVATSGILTFPAGVFAVTFTVPVLPNTRDDGDRVFTVQLSSPTGGATLGLPSAASVVIRDDDISGIVQFGAAIHTATECPTMPCVAVLTVRRTGGGSSGVTVDFATIDGTATALADYVATTGQVSFASGQMSAVIRIPLQIEPGAQSVKAFSVILTNPRGGATLGAQSTTEVRITDTR